MKDSIVLICKVNFTSFLFSFSAYIENVGYRDGDAEQAQAEVHGDDQQHQQLLQRLHLADATERYQLELTTKIAFHYLCILY